MADGYTGWKLLDKVTIVAKKMLVYDYKTGSTTDTGNVQGYLVDPSNKKQLENARQWGTTTTWEYFTDEEGHTSVRNKIEYKPEEYTYDNDGFTLELSEAANGSWQGGKLSFWNCWITAPDGHRFLIGIAADLLLDVLKSTTVINGVVQEKLMFARCHGGVGMLSKTMDSYKDAINDMSIKKTMSQGKTKKHQIGHVYETATLKNVYLGDVYRWYDPIYEDVTTGFIKLTGFKKRSSPVKYRLFPAYRKDLTKMSEYLSHWMPLELTLPARKESDNIVELDITLQDVCDYFNKITILDKVEEYVRNKEAGHIERIFLSPDNIGLSSNNVDYTMPEEIVTALNTLGFRVEN